MEVNLPIIFTAVVGLLIIYYYVIEKRFSKYGIPYQHPLISFYYTILVTLKKFSFILNMHQLYYIDEKAKYVGAYDLYRPMVLIRDPELIKDVTVKHFENFVDRRVFIDVDADPLFGGNLSALGGDRWREVRNLLSPTFTSSKMKTMYKLMSQCAETFTDSLIKQSAKQTDFNSKDIFSYYTNDTIATCAFGVSVDSMKDPDNEFYRFGRKATNFESFSMFKLLIYQLSPKLYKLLKLEIIPKDVERFFYQLIRDTIAMRDEKGIVRPDMLQLMMETRHNKPGSKKPELTVANMTSHAFIFFFAGFELISNLLCWAVHEIASSSEIQKRLQEEIDDVYQRCDGEPTYEAINSMKYLDAIIDEVLRLYPISVMTDRMCTKEYELPPALPGSKPFVLRKGDSIMIPIWGLHKDPNYFPEPDKFSPDRFLDENQQNINSLTYIPFSVGPRMCIGNRFALLESKVLLVHLFRTCNVEPSEKMILPAQIDWTSMNLMVKGGFWIKVQPRQF
ncbi:cytochrome P450 9e2-like [Chelonus insularis]|uniref:cytochrome P450 9e2-like n=1 Tax=Chelonus insularis TaxID=460826 RepID=UPI001589B9B6|nr:cytochrome P450 9e2-like [Chelonus insularis]